MRVRLEKVDEVGCTRLIELVLVLGLGLGLVHLSLSVKLPLISFRMSLGEINSKIPSASSEVFQRVSHT